MTKQEILWVLTTTGIFHARAIKFKLMRIFELIIRRGCFPYSKGQSYTCFECRRCHGYKDFMEYWKEYELYERNLINET